jgi:hypothetical protein
MFLATNSNINRKFDKRGFYYVLDNGSRRKEETYNLFLKVIDFIPCPVYKRLPTRGHSLPGWRNLVDAHG